MSHDIRSKSAEEIKREVREKYAAISRRTPTENTGSCCGSCDCGEVDYSVFADDYSGLEGYNPEADLSLGCGLPTEHAHIRQGDTVVDLGSGAGNDCFVSRSLTGPAGKVIGIDMTGDMVDKARENARKLGFDNVVFVEGEIEDIPLEEQTADVVVSNCVFNLVPDKEAAFGETLRILKKGGHFSISDVVTEGDLPEGLKSDAELYAGCVAGAISLDTYLNIIRDAGFEDIRIQKKKPVNLPDELLKRYLSEAEVQLLQKGDRGLFSVTVFAKKPE